MNKIINYLLLLAAFTGLAQDNSDFIPNIAVPAPSSYALGNYGNVPVGLFKGTAEINIPLLTYKTKNLAVPLSLFYGSNGIKVDDLSSSTGLGWNMNGIGIITRTVNDVADEKYNPNISAIPADSELYGQQLSANAIRYLYGIANNPNADSETDIFSFNVNGISGKFVYDVNRNPVVIDNFNVKIEKGTSNSFIITANDGIKYVFLDIETTLFRTLNSGHQPPVSNITSWYLTKMIHPQGDEINFQYDNNGYTFTASESQSLMISSPYTQQSCGNEIYQYGPVLSNIKAHTMNVSGKRVSQISSNNPFYGKLLFYYRAASDPVAIENSKIDKIIFQDNSSFAIDEVNFQYVATANKRTFLTSVSFKDISKKYSFEYISPDLFPLRLSKSQDHWGYFNGKYNTSLVPKVPNVPDVTFASADKEPVESKAKIGMLSKICYPTKGCTEFEYESNSYYGRREVYPNTVSDFISVYLDGSQSSAQTSESTLLIPSTQVVNLTAFGGFNVYACNASQDIGHSQAYLTVFCTDLNQPVQLYVKAQNGQLIPEQSTLTENMVHSQFYFYATGGMTYKVKLMANRRCSFGDCTITYKDGDIQIVNDNIITGGVRVKSTRDTDNSISKGYKRFYYAPLSNLQISSGVVFGNPHYIDKITTRKACASNDPLAPIGPDLPAEILCVHYDLTLLRIGSSSLLSLYNLGSSINYQYVTVSEGDDNFGNGGEQHEYLVTTDLPGDVLHLNDFTKSSMTNTGWDNGMEKKSSIFKKDSSGHFKTVKEKVNDYIRDERMAKEIYSYPIRKNFELDCYGDGQLNSIENLDIMRTVIFQNWYYMKSSKETDNFYDQNGLLNGSIETESYFTYNNPSHCQLSSQKAVVSTGAVLETKYYYPPDTESVNEPNVNGVDGLIAKNIVANPLLVRAEHNGQIISEKRTVYAKDNTTNNLLVPKNIFNKKGIGSLEKKITYDRYDAKGNILQYTLENGMPVSFIWGYDSSQPIAKIENATFSQVLATLSLTEAATGQLLETPLILRSSLPNAMITTYTYKPLVGVTSITDPKGMKTTYEYDSFGRLKEVRDNDGKLLSENEYHYKN